MYALFNIQTYLCHVARRSRLTFRQINKGYYNCNHFKSTLETLNLILLKVKKSKFIYSNYFFFPRNEYSLLFKYVATTNQNTCITYPVWFSYKYLTCNCQAGVIKVSFTVAFTDSFYPLFWHFASHINGLKETLLQERDDVNPNKREETNTLLFDT